MYMDKSKQDPLKKALQEASRELQVPSEQKSRKNEDFDVEQVIKLASEARETFNHEDFARFCI